MATDPQHTGKQDTSNPGRPLPEHTLNRTRTGGLWAALACFALVLLLLLIFILQNSRTVDVSYFGVHGHLPLGVALLLAAVFGVLLVVLAGSARILQLRATARRHSRLDAERQTQPAQPTQPAQTAQPTQPAHPAPPSGTEA